jgi:hypothetical protein
MSLRGLLLLERDADRDNAYALAALIGVIIPLLTRFLAFSPLRLGSVGVSLPVPAHTSADIAAGDSTGEGCTGGWNEGND